ncbi:MAG: thiol oxidoreductase [Candidatus Latescibacteria bacterium]|nr:thiol oxidoreductase [Candidatus Latescibacterota bacterium]
MERVAGFLWVLALLGAAGCDRIMTSAPPAGDAFSSPLDGLGPDLNAVFVQGDENFARVFTVEEGLGPIFNNLSCEGCHPGDGRGTPQEGFFRFSREGDLLTGQGGPQHQDKSIPGVPLEEVPAGVEQSFRLPPPVFGMGLIEAIPVETILAEEDPDDRDGDGISGRANWVLAPDFVPQTHVGGGAGLQLGRFSRKAQVSALVHQVAAAYHGDIGITSDFLPEENPHPQAGGVALGDQVPDPEIPAATVLQTVMYVRLLSPPDLGERTAQVAQGEAVFTRLRCAACHVPSMKTGPHYIPQLSGQEARLYSDLLLHDMGPGLADNRPDGDATGSEWRTAPLWGTRLVEEFLGGRGFFLHDGRAPTLDQAIRAHGGEAQASREAYVGLAGTEQQALLAFLGSL